MNKQLQLSIRVKLTLSFNALQHSPTLGETEAYSKASVIADIMLQLYICIVHFKTDIFLTIKLVISSVFANNPANTELH